MRNTNSSNASEHRWLLATYRPVSLFSLRSTFATNKGGKALVVPTPYAVKLALVDACFRACKPNDAIYVAQKVLELVRAARIKFLPPEHCIIENTFVKVKQKARESEQGIFTSTIAYRELCFFKGDLILAIEATELSTDDCELLISILKHINYFGKRGSFFQFIEARVVDELQGNFSFLDTDDTFEIGGYGLMQALDDFGEADFSDLFDRINTYRSDKPMTLGKHRILANTFLPYQMIGSSRRYTYYRRQDS